MGYTHRTLAERIEREGALRRGDPPNRIAERLGRSAGTPGRDRALKGGRDHDRALSRAPPPGPARRDCCAITAPPPGLPPCSVRVAPRNTDTGCLPRDLTR